MQKIQGEAKTIRQLLSGAKYAIDDYQREYKWETKQIRELLEDLTSKFLEEHEPTHLPDAVEHYPHYFLGAIIVSHKGGQNFLVDGQQRVTSLTLLLIYLNNLQKTDAGRQVNVADLIYSERFGQKSFNLMVDERAACMEALFEEKEFDPEGQPEAVANLLARYADIDSAFPEVLRGESRPFFMDWLIENVHLVEITAFSGEDAYTIFETMNDRGLSLSPIDMLKGYVLANIPDASKRTEANDLWKRRVHALVGIGKDVDADFFKAWLRSQYANTIREQKKGSLPGDFDRIGSEFHRWIRDVREDLGLTGGEAFQSFIRRDFDFYSRQYLRLMAAGETMMPGLEAIFYNAQAGFTLQPMVLMAPISPGEDNAGINLKWGLAAAYLDILLTRRIWNYKSVDQSTMKYPMFRLMLKARGQDASALAEVLFNDLSQQADELAFTERFALHQMNRRPIARILARITDYIETGSGMPSHYLEYTRDANRYEVEHIWANKPERHTDEFSHPADFQEYRNRIGDLLLLPKKFNAAYGDMPYEEKMPHYLGQNLLARSLHPQCYDHNPGFLQFLQRTGLPFRPHCSFRKADLDERNHLYRQIAERIWNPMRLMEMANA